MREISLEQIRQLMLQTNLPNENSLYISHEMLSELLNCPKRLEFPVSRSDLDLMELIKLAVGKDGHIDQDLNFTGKVASDTKLELASFFNPESLEEAAARLEDGGFKLENAAELAVFFERYPNEAKKYNKVFALGRDSRWESEPGVVNVPFVCNEGGQRSFSLSWLGYMVTEKHDYNARVIVSRRPK